MSRMTHAYSYKVKKRKKEARKDRYEVIQIRTLLNAEGMLGEIPVEGLTSWSVQDLSQKQLARCVLTKQTDHQQL